MLAKIYGMPFERGPSVGKQRRNSLGTNYGTYGPEGDLLIGAYFPLSKPCPAAGWLPGESK
jgi:hypothetical protein